MTTPKLTRDELAQYGNVVPRERVEALLDERDALAAALDQRNEFTAKRVVGELEKHGVVMGDQFDTMKADRDRLLAACEALEAALAGPDDWGSPNWCERVWEKRKAARAAIAESRRA